MNCCESDDVAYAIRCRAGYLYWLYSRCRRSYGFEDSEFTRWVEEKRSCVLTRWDEIYSPSLRGGKSGAILSKSFIMLFYLREFLLRYPATKVIVMSRPPAEVVASTLSLIDSVTCRFFPFRRLRQNEIENILQAVRLYYRQLEVVFNDPSLSSSILCLEFSEVTANLSLSCRRISNFLPYGDWDPVAIKRQSEIQKNRVSSHRYKIEQFGISAERVIREIHYA